MSLVLLVLDDATHLICEPVTEDGFTDPLEITLGVTAVVRYWGTTKGRGQLALTGPTEKTIVDPEPEGGTVNRLHVRRTIPVTEEAEAKWRKILSR